MDNQLNHVSDDLSPFDGFVRRSPIADETELLDLRSHNIGNIDWLI